MKRTLRITALSFATILLVGMVVGCPSSGFDRTTFDALATSNAVISQAQTDYESGALPHTTCVYNAINKAKAAQGVAETAFLAYYKVEEAKGDVTATEGAVASDLAAIGPLVASIKVLYTTPNCGA